MVSLALLGGSQASEERWLPRPLVLVPLTHPFFSVIFVSTECTHPRFRVILSLKGLVGLNSTPLDSPIPCLSLDTLRYLKVT